MLSCTVCCWMKRCHDAVHKWLPNPRALRDYESLQLAGLPMARHGIMAPGRVRGASLNVRGRIALVRRNFLVGTTNGSDAGNTSPVAHSHLGTIASRMQHVHAFEDILKMSSRDVVGYVGPFLRHCLPLRQWFRCARVPCLSSQTTGSQSLVRFRRPRPW